MIRIRPAVVADAATLAAIEQTQPTSACWGPSGISSELQNKVSRILCAEKEGQTVGFICARAVAEVAEILNFAVLSVCVRQGIGQALLQRMVADLYRSGVTEITLEVNEHNQAALALYKKTGFAEIGRRKKFYNNQDDALLLKKLL